MQPCIEEIRTASCQKHPVSEADWALRSKLFGRAVPRPGSLKFHPVKSPSSFKVIMIVLIAIAIRRIIVTLIVIFIN